MELCTKNYENLSIFVKVTAKKSVVPFYKLLTCIKYWGLYPFVHLKQTQARSQKCEIGGGANDESGGAAGRARESRGRRRRGSKG